MRYFLFLLILTSANALSQPYAKEHPFYEKRFGILIKDEYKWMEQGGDQYYLVDWLKKQFKYTRSHLDKKKFDYFYRKIDGPRKFISKFVRGNKNKLQFFNQRLGQYESLSKFNHPSSMPSLLEELKIKNKESGKLSTKYTTEVSDIPETGSGYGAFQRIKVFNKNNGKLVEIVSPQALSVSIIDWIDDERFIYSATKKKHGVDFATSLTLHKVDNHPSEDEEIYGVKSSQYFDVLKFQDKYFFNFYDLTDRSQYILHFDLSKRKVLKRIPLGKLRTTLLSKKEGNDFFLYTMNYEKYNYGVLEKVRITDGKSIPLFKTDNYIVTELYSMGENSGLVFVAFRDGISMLGVFNGKKARLLPSQPLDGSYYYLGQMNGKFRFLHMTYGDGLKDFLLDPKAGKLELKNSAHYYPSGKRIKVKRIHYTATNGQRAVVSVVSREGVRLNSKTPMILFGYGGWYHIEFPFFNSNDSFGWLEKGGAFAFATVPGSLAYGMSWNHHAKAGNRKNSFDSFANAGKELIRRRMTSPSKLGIMGASNGGLLVAGAMERHKKLFKAVVPIAGVLNMIDIYRNGLYWEYGNPYKKRTFFKLMKISPYHKLKRASYPAILVQTGREDNIVLPQESYKYVARLQKLQTNENNPVLLHVSNFAGHHPISASMKIHKEKMASIYAFFAEQLGL